MYVIILGIIKGKYQVFCLESFKGKKQLKNQDFNLKKSDPFLLESSTFDNEIRLTQKVVHVSTNKTIGDGHSALFRGGFQSMNNSWEGGDHIVIEKRCYN